MASKKPMPLALKQFAILRGKNAVSRAILLRYNWNNIPTICDSVRSIVFVVNQFYERC